MLPLTLSPRVQQAREPARVTSRRPSPRGRLGIGCQQRRRQHRIITVLGAHVDAQVPGRAVDIAALGALGRAEVGGHVAFQVDRRLVAATAHATRAARP